MGANLLQFSLVVYFQKQESKNFNHDAHKAHEEENGDDAERAMKLCLL
jgi:hypothetical protein